MELISYQYADLTEIENLKDDQFAKLVKNKIYVINPQFVNSESCMDRLIEHLTSLPIGKDTLKLVRNLVKYFQTPILYCLKEFYSRNKKCFKDMVSNQNQESSTNSTKKALKFLQQIGSITMKLISGTQQIEELDFLTKYGLSNKEIDLEIKEQKYHQSYLKWLKKSLVGLKVMKNQTISEKARTEWIERTQKEFEELVESRTSIWLEKFALNEIIMQSEDVSDPHKNITSQNNKNNQNHNGGYQNQQKSLSENKTEFIANQIQALNSISPSQRKYFYQNQNLSHAEDINLQYKNFKAPYDTYSVKRLRRAICAFLNRAGGVIFVGIKQDVNDKNRVVKGQILSEYKKQQVLKQYKYICSQIRPDIIAHGKFRIRFVPIKDRNNKYIQGKYIVRVEVTKGDERSFYTVKEDNDDFVMLRTDNQVLKRGITQKTLFNFKMRLLQPTKHPPLQPCAQPDVGIPLLEDKYVTRYNQKHQNSQQTDDLQGCYKNPNYENKQKWKLKSQPVSPPTTQIKSKDFVYMNVKKELTNIKLQQQKGNKTRNITSRKGFICDEEEYQDEDEHVVEQQEEVKQKQVMINKKQSVTQYQQPQQKAEIDQNEKDNKNYEQDDLPDFKPINPVIVSKYHQSKQSYQTSSKKNSAKNYNKFEPYQVNRTPLNKPIERPPSIDLLVIGLTYTKVHQLTINIGLPLIELPINCNDDMVTWVSIKIEKGIQIMQKIRQFMELLNTEWKKIPDSPQKKSIKVRKLFSNVYFQDEILLNKFVNKFGHDEQFEDERFVYYYKCKDNYQAIQAYMIGYQHDIKIKFISNEQLKEKKLAHLKAKVEKRQSQKNHNSKLIEQFMD